MVSHKHTKWYKTNTQNDRENERRKNIKGLTIKPQQGSRYGAVGRPVVSDTKDP